jgi:hypothetical protein
MSKRIRFSTRNLLTWTAFAAYLLGNLVLIGQIGESDRALYLWAGFQGISITLFNLAMLAFAIRSRRQRKEMCTSRSTHA